MSKRILNFMILAGILFGPLFQMAMAHVPGIRILSSTERSCSFELTVDDLQIDTVAVGNVVYQRFTFPLSSGEGSVGEPMIPCRVVVIGIPQGADVRVSASPSESIEKGQARLLPVPELQRIEGFPTEVYVEGTSYKNPGFVPQQLFTADSPSYSGDQRIVRIKVYPLQFDPVQNKVRYYEKITVNVQFVGGHPSPPGSSYQRKQDTVFEKGLVNPLQARRWRDPVTDPSSISKRLFSGEVYKLPVYEDGVYRVTGAFLEDQGIDLASIQPTTVKIYNNGGRELPRGVLDARPDSLVENPIIPFGLDDGQFDESDYFLFYGRGVNGWEYNSNQDRYEHYINHFTDHNVYWLIFNDGQPARTMTAFPAGTAANTEIIQTFQERIYLEQEIVNHLLGGTNWGGQLFTSPSSQRSFDLNIQNPVASEPMQFRFQFMGAASGTNQFHVRLNSQSIGTFQFSGPSQAGGPRINLYTRSASLSNITFTGSDALSFDYTGLSQGSKAYLDWYEVEYTSLLAAQNGTLSFTSPISPGFYTYQISGFTEAPIILDVTDGASVRRRIPLSSGSHWTFTDTVQLDAPKMYYAFNASVFLNPQNLIADESDDLRQFTQGADMVIITPQAFYDQAQRLKDLREEHDSLSVFIADIEEIYDEFAWGLPDPTAIRDFMRYAYTTWSIRPSYLLLFGDGDYDYKGLRSDGSTSWIPPYENEGLTEAGSRPTDDFYTYVNGNDSDMDLSVGRITAQTAGEATAIVDKIIQYETEPEWGDWRSLITLVGDDEKAQSGAENEVTHTRAAEYIATHILPDQFNRRKIYLSEYPEEITVEGRRKPAAREDLIAQINRGTLVVNFVGHGNEVTWAHERVLERESVMPRLENGRRLPFFYAATCAFGLYDDPYEQSFTEELLAAESRGAIGVVAASRFCSASPNEALNKAFMNYVFDEFGPTLRLGDALRLGKLSTVSTTNNEMYHVFGDPAMRLGAPRHRAVITKIKPDSMKALSLVQVEGYIEKDGAAWTGFNGPVLVKAFDSKKDIVYTTQYGTPLNYQLPGNAIFRGEAQADNGQFQTSFIVPKDILYGGHTGRIHCYFQDDVTDGAGYQDDIEVGGSSNLIDLDGPDVDIYFDGLDDFITGGMVPENPVFKADVVDDKSGINITGEIGHKIILTLDGLEKIDITEYFRYDQGSYLQGQIEYPLSNLEEGEHELHLKIWDNANNSAEQSLTFRVIPGDEMRLERVLNYPNPFQTSTHFTFHLNRDADIEIKIFTVNGLLIRRLEGFLGEPGFNMIAWDGLDEMGDELANGVYLYKVIARAQEGTDTITSEKIERLMIVR